MRTRPLKPSFCKNEVIAEVDPWCRLVLQVLWMMADRNGRLEHRWKKIKAEGFPHDDAATVNVPGRLDELAKHGLIRVYEVRGNRYIEIPNFTKHARPHRDEQVDETIPPPPEKIPAHPVPAPIQHGEKPTTSDVDGKKTDEPGENTAGCAVSCIPIAVSPTVPCPSESREREIFNPGMHHTAKDRSTRLIGLYMSEVKTTHVNTKSAAIRELAQFLMDCPTVEDGAIEHGIRLYAKQLDKNQSPFNRRQGPLRFVEERAWESYEGMTEAKALSEAELIEIVKKERERNERNAS